MCCCARPEALASFRRRPPSHRPPPLRVPCRLLPSRGDRGPGPRHGGKGASLQVPPAPCHRRRAPHAPTGRPRPGEVEAPATPSPTSRPQSSPPWSSPHSARVRPTALTALTAPVTRTASPDNRKPRPAPATAETLPSVEHHRHHPETDDSPARTPSRTPRQRLDTSRLTPARTRNQSKAWFQTLPLLQPIRSKALSLSLSLSFRMG